MHNHNSGNKNGGHKGMLWMMLPCILLLGFLLLGGSKFIPSEYLLLVILGVCVVPHVWMLFKGHGGNKNEDAEDKHKKDGCCH